MSQKLESSMAELQFSHVEVERFLNDSVFHCTKTPAFSLTRDFLGFLPQVYRGENDDRLRLILHGTPAHMVSELFTIACFLLSNKALHQSQWGFVLDVLEGSGLAKDLWKSQIKSTTLLAFRETLFQMGIDCLKNPALFKTLKPKVMANRTVQLLGRLLKSGQDPNTGIRSGPRKITRMTALQAAVEIGNSELQVMLLQYGADPNLLLDDVTDDELLRIRPMRWTRPPLLIAISEASTTQHAPLHSFQQLLSHGANIMFNQDLRYGFLATETALTVAARQQDHQLACHFVQTILSLLDLHSKGRLLTADVAVSAAASGNLAVLKLLRANGLDLTTANPLGLRAIHAATYEGHVDCCRELLLMEGDGPRIEDGIPSPLHMACYKRQAEVVQFLLDSGCPADIRLDTTNADSTLLLTRVFCVSQSLKPDSGRRTKAVAELRTPVLAAMYRDSYYGTQIHPPYRPAERGPLGPTLRALLQAEAEVPSNILHEVIWNLDLEVLSDLLGQGFDPDLEDDNGMTPLSFLLFSFSEATVDDALVYEPELCADMARLLLGSGAKVSQGDAVLAVELEDWELVDEILENDENDIARVYTSRQPDTITLLERLFSKDQSTMVQAEFDHDPSIYSPGALCAATWHCVSGRSSETWLDRLLINRGSSPRTLHDHIVETSAICIAAFYSDMSVLDRLLSVIPIVDGARVKVLVVSDQPEDLDELCRHAGVAKFWYDGQLGTVFGFAAFQSPVLNRLLDHGYKLDSRGLWRLTCSENRMAYIDLIRERYIPLHDSPLAYDALVELIYDEHLEAFMPCYPSVETSAAGQTSTGIRIAPTDHSLLWPSILATQM